jgi:hypothetical protein
MLAQLRPGVLLFKRLVLPLGACRTRHHAVLALAALTPSTRTLDAP